MKRCFASRIAVCILCALTAFGALAFTINLLRLYRGFQAVGIADRTGSDNINVLLSRPDNWRKVVTAPVVERWDVDSIDGSTATIPITADILRQFYDYTDEQVREAAVVWHSTTHTAYEYLIQQNRYGYEDTARTGHRPALLFVTPPSDEELAMAQANRCPLELAPIARDGFVFITHKDNPVDSLTLAQLRGIYTGRITNWQEVGGNDRPIAAYQREKNSGSQTAMEQLVMRGEALMAPREVKVYMSMGGLVDAVAEYENGPAAIGYTYDYYLHNLYRNEDIKVLRVDGVAPTHAHLRDGSYPLAANYYAVLRRDEPAGAPARVLRDWLLTDEGQRLVEMAGYCPGAGPVEIVAAAEQEAVS